MANIQIPERLPKFFERVIFTWKVVGDLGAAAREINALCVGTNACEAGRVNLVVVTGGAQDQAPVLDRNQRQIGVAIVEAPFKQVNNAPYSPDGAPMSWRFMDDGASA